MVGIKLEKTIEDMIDYYRWNCTMVGIKPGTSLTNIAGESVLELYYGRNQTLDNFQNFRRLIPKSNILLTMCPSVSQSISNDFCFVSIYHAINSFFARHVELSRVMELSVLGVRRTPEGKIHKMLVERMCARAKK